MVSQRPGEFIGMRFFSPITVIKMMRFTQGTYTSDETFANVAELSKFIGKEPAEVNQVPSSVVNKILISTVNGVCDLVYTGFASVEGLDTAMKLGINHPMIPWP